MTRNPRGWVADYPNWIELEGASRKVLESGAGDDPDSMTMNPVGGWPGLPNLEELEAQAAKRVGHVVKITGSKNFFARSG